MGLAPFWGKILIFTRFLRNSMAMIKARHFVNSACAIFSLWKQDPPHQTFPSYLARADISCQFMKRRAVCRHCLQKWTLLEKLDKFLVHENKNAPSKIFFTQFLEPFGNQTQKKIKHESVSRNIICHLFSHLFHSYFFRFAASNLP